MMSTIASYFQLTKPRIMVLVVFSGATALFLDGSLLIEPFHFIMVLTGLYLTGGSANALNQYLERDIDAKMTRTANRRPLPQGKINPTKAFIFSLSIGLLGVILFYISFNLLSALLALATILFYSLFYTLWLKPNTPLNIVIGGAAGSAPPLIAWAAATGTIENLVPWILFLIIFFWTPPHFWALALYYKEDYVKADLPMLPVVKGEDETLRQIFIYTLILVGITLTMFLADFYWTYLVVSLALGGLFIKKSYETKKLKTPKLERGLFLYSIIYLFSLFLALIADSFINRFTSS
ncbi:MAG: protoheme IX farnesyltransferase [bacterium]|nr:MAG: protoheme IX farnesyltransferase [bacterium]